jgi:TonB family protein
MSAVPSSATATEPVSASHPRELDSRVVRRWRGVARFSLLAALVTIACMALYHGVPIGSLLEPRSLQVLTLDDAGLRQLAITTFRPAYPAASLANRVTGVVVASLTIDVNGRTRTVEIIEAPDAATGRAVRDALVQWAFRPLEVAARVEAIAGNIIFYFHLQGARGVVSSSDEMQATRGVKPLEGPERSQPVVRTIGEAEYRRLRSTVALVVLDTRSRAAYLEGHRDAAIGIPLRELSSRAAAELPLSQLIVVDCFPEQLHAGLCVMAGHMLTSSGFSDVAILNRSLN